MSFLAAIKHVSAAGGTETEPRGSWEYTPVKGLDGPTIIVRLVFGKKVIDFDVPVCGFLNPRLGAWLLHHHRGSREVWLLSENCFLGDLKRSPISTPFASGMVRGSIELLACPPHIAEELERLNEGPR